MVWRAKKLRQSETATTSSFPSRAVTCATVYAFFICYAYVYKVVHKDFGDGSEAFQWWMLVLLLLAVLLSSFARVNMGVHYPSDCVAGFIQGIIVCAIGTALWDSSSRACSSCFTKECYADPLSETAITKDHLMRLNWTVLVISFLVSLLITAISVMKPVDFWSKCDRIYGMLFPGLIFKMTFLCPVTAHSSLPAPPPSPWYGYIYGLAFVGLATGIAWKNNGKYPVVSFLILCLFMYCGLVAWRLWLLT